VLNGCHSRDLALFGSVTGGEGFQGEFKYCDLGSIVPLPFEGTAAVSTGDVISTPATPHNK